MNKLSFISSNNRSSPSALLYTPFYPGTCVEADSSRSITAYLNPRDFPSSLNFFLTLNMMFILSVPSLEQNFVPDFNLYSIRDPLMASELRRNAEDPRISSFDVDLKSQRILLHFSDFVNISTFSISEFSLISVQNSTSVTLVSSWLMAAESGSSFVRTICIRISDMDFEAMTNYSVCTTSADDCGSYFPATLVSSFNGFPLLNVTDQLPLPVSYNYMRLVLFS